MTNAPNRTGKKTFIPWVIQGRSFTRPYLVAHIQQLIEVRLGGRANTRQIAEAFGDPAYLNAAAWKKLRALLDAMAEKRQLIKDDERGYFRMGSTLRGGNAIEVHAKARKILLREGGRCRSRVLFAMEPSEAAIEAGAGPGGLNKDPTEKRNEHIYDILRRPDSPARRDYRLTHFYNLPQDELRNMVLEGRWAILDVHYAYDQSVPLSKRPLFTGVSFHPADNMVASLLEGIGRRLRFFCEYHDDDKGSAILHDDPDVMAALRAAVLRMDHSFRSNKEHRLDEGPKALLAKFIDGEPRAHKAMRTDFYVAVGKRLNIDPVSWSWGGPGYLFPDQQFPTVETEDDEVLEDEDEFDVAER